MKQKKLAPAQPVAPVEAEVQPPVTQPPLVVEGAPPPAPPKVACVPKSLSRTPPKYPDTDAALRDAGGAADRYQLMAAGRLLRMHRLADLEKALEGCR